MVLFNSLNQAQATWARSTNHHHLVDFASTCRVNFLFRLLQGPGPAFYDAGGGEHDQPSQPAQASTAPGPPPKKEDPWKHYDPWMKCDPKPKQQRHLFSTKWEDLTLPKDHPIQDEKDASNPQIHRLQAAAVKHGVVLITKPMLQEYAKIPATQTFVLVLPANDKNPFVDMGFKPLRPYEVVLNDQQLHTAYKRLVVLIAVAGTVQYKLPAAKITFTAAEVSEVVLDADSRLMSPGHFEQIRAHQLEAFRRLLLDIYPDAKDRVQFYAFRAGSSNGSSKQDGTFQCIVKLPQSIRRDILSLSGTQGLLIRDYINGNAMPSDLLRCHF